MAKEQQLVEIWNAAPMLTTTALETFPLKVSHGRVELRLDKAPTFKNTPTLAEFLEDCALQHIKPFNIRSEFFYNSNDEAVFELQKPVLAWSPTYQECEENQQEIIDAFDSLFTPYPYLQLIYNFKSTFTNKKRHAFGDFRERHFKPLLKPQGYIPYGIILDTADNEAQNIELALPYGPIGKTTLTLTIGQEVNKSQSQKALSWIRELAEQGRYSRCAEIWES